VWTKSVGTQHIFRLDLATKTWERFKPTDTLTTVNRAAIYQVISDSRTTSGWPSSPKAISARSTPRRLR
jgi:hypothetical protein